jgi:hypothetical protein
MMLFIKQQSQFNENIYGAGMLERTIDIIYGEIKKYIYFLKYFYEYLLVVICNGFRFGKYFNNYCHKIYIFNKGKKFRKGWSIY